MTSPAEIQQVGVNILDATVNLDTVEDVMMALHFAVCYVIITASSEREERFALAEWFNHNVHTFLKESRYDRD